VISRPREHRGHTSASAVGDSPFAIFGATVRGLFGAFGFAARRLAQPAVRAGSRRTFVPGPLWPPGTLAFASPGDGSSTTRYGSAPFGSAAPRDHARFGGASRLFDDDDDGSIAAPRLGGASRLFDDDGSIAAPRLGGASRLFDDDDDDDGAVAAPRFAGAIRLLDDDGGDDWSAVADHARFGGAVPPGAVADGRARSSFAGARPAGAFPGGEAGARPAGALPGDGEAGALEPRIASTMSVT
jgi:hypothetical protein